MRRTALSALAALGLVGLVAGCGEENPAVKEGAAPWQTSAASGQTTSGSAATTKAAYTADLADASGKKVGTVSIAKAEHGMTVTVTASGLPAGFHASHLHAIGKCEAKSADPTDATKTGDFLSAGGHLKGSGTDHPEHAGDLPMLYVAKDGTGSLTTTTDRLTDDLLGQSAGVAMVIHAGADNYANSPSRYTAGGVAGPDAETKKAGDAGSRIACGVLTKA